VLFADLVGFTPLSEQRDAEDVRELLSRYFATARTIIARYGGTVEKFIGDAVMAVWGVPVVHESDAERAVRAALELVDAVAAFGEAVAAPDLRARAGVLTGEAAIRVGVIGEGMVAGDLVNTASRVQSVAEPGSVFVGDATRQSSEARVARAQGQAGASPPLACPARRRQPRSMQQAPTRRRSRRMHIGEDRAAGLCVAHVLLISLTRETP
jgi:class 3 adenylate cyclase